MAAHRKVMEISIDDTEASKLQTIARSRTEAASRVERARILLAYRDDPSLYAVGRAVGVTHQTVQRCLARAIRFGVLEALDDSPRPGKQPAITTDARTWLVSLACQKPKDLGYPHEIWTPRLLARHAREHGPAAGHVCLAQIAQGTVCKILADQEVKPHKMRYYLERRDPEFDTKMPKSCVFIRKLPSCERRKLTRRRSAPKLIQMRRTRPLPMSRSSLMTRSQASRRSPTQRPICRRSRASTRASPASMNTSAMGR